MVRKIKIISSQFSTGKSIDLNCAKAKKTLFYNKFLVFVLNLEIGNWKLFKFYYRQKFLKSYFLNLFSNSGYGDRNFTTLTFFDHPKVHIEKRKQELVAFLNKYLNLGLG